MSGHLVPDFGPFDEKRTRDDGLDNAFDHRRVGVVRTELRTLAWIKASLEESAEDRGFDCAPIQSGDVFEKLKVVGFERQTTSFSNRLPLNQSTRSSP